MTDMSRLDLVKLRKVTGISQKDLAEKLSVRPSFLSAIENGRSRFPDEKIDRLKEILSIDDLSDFMTEDVTVGSHEVPPHSHAIEETDAITQLLKHIHAQAHKSDDVTRARELELEERIIYLSKRNDRLSDRVDQLRDEVDVLREENFRLKELLTRNNISY